ncbi:MAG: carbonic anhydrase [Planctomycetota bacterium]|nr:carbonic anhydrase [Planctomycetota bacterium]
MVRLDRNHNGYGGTNGDNNAGMHRLVAGIHEFQSNVFQSQRELFENLAGGQRPGGLFITCSDSRINPNLITQTDPGELFILRNVGNIVPPFSPTTADGGASAAIEFAVTALDVEYIVICGHSHCGAMKGLLHPEDLTEMPSVSAWLGNAESARRIVRTNYTGLSEEDQMSVMIQENVLVQLENLRTHPAVAVRLAPRGDLRLYGWVYKIETGEVFAYSADEGQFVSLSDMPAALTQTAATNYASMRAI